MKTWISLCSLIAYANLADSHMIDDHSVLVPTCKSEVQFGKGDRMNMWKSYFTITCKGIKFTETITI